MKSEISNFATLKNPLDDRFLLGFEDVPDHVSGLHDAIPLQRTYSHWIKGKDDFTLVLGGGEKIEAGSQLNAIAKAP